MLSLCLLPSCGPNSREITELLEHNPEIIINAIEKNPTKFAGVFQKFGRGIASQGKSPAERQKEEAQRLEREFKNPLKPELDPKRPVMGSTSAPITIVEYTDFQCPYCSRAYNTIEELKKEFGPKLKVVVKNLPLSFHAMAMPAAQRFEALMLQDPKKAFNFYHEVFKNQGDLKNGEKYLDSVVTKVGGNLKKVKKDMNSDKVKQLIAKDMAEAKAFGINGTPGFVVNGVTLHGAQPAPMFKNIINRHLASIK